MATKIRRSFKSWMLVYAGFAVALAAANIEPPYKPAATAVSLESMPAGIAIGQAFFLPAINHSRRNDI